MDRAVVVRAERLDVTTPDGRGKGRIKARAAALALSGNLSELQLSRSGKYGPVLQSPGPAML